MQLFNIAGVDYTGKILVPSWKVSRFAECAKWTDGNKIDHRDITRYRCSGSCTMWFDSQTEYLAFLAALRQHTTADGYVTCTVYANNDNAVYTINAYIDIDPSNTLPQLGRGDHDGIQIKITER